LIYHISADGKPRPCRATQNCPIGGAHFQTKLSAIAFLEAEELKLNGGGSFGRQLDRDQRYRLAKSNVLSTMRYNQETGDSVYDQYGNEWVIEEQHDSGDSTKPIFKLRRKTDGKYVTLNPKNEVQRYDTAVKLDPDTGDYKVSTVVKYLTRKETGNWTIRDFYETVPEPLVLDKPPRRSSPKYYEIPRGVTVMEGAAVRHINVHTSVDDPVSSRWLIVEKTDDEELTEKQHRELVKAAYEQTGRPLSSFAKLSDFQKSEYVNFDWRPVRITNDGENIVLEHFSADDQTFQVTGELIRPADIIGYKLD
jgi:hypothetical protein